MTLNELNARAQELGIDGDAELGIAVFDVVPRGQPIKDCVRGIEADLGKLILRPEVVLEVTPALPPGQRTFGMEAWTAIIHKPNGKVANPICNITGVSFPVFKAADAPNLLLMKASGEKQGYRSDICRVKVTIETIDLPPKA